MTRISRQKEGLDAIIREIVQVAGPEKILLLSASYQYRLTENIFIKNPVEEFRGCQYDLLVLADGRGEKSLVDLVSLTQNRLCSQNNLHVHFTDIHEFNKEVEAGDEYACFIHLNALLCYDKSDASLSDKKKV
jgi:hypothetical protein